MDEEEAILPGLEGYTPQEIADAVGLSRSYVSEIMRGEKVPDRKHRKKTTDFSDRTWPEPRLVVRIETKCSPVYESRAGFKRSPQHPAYLWWLKPPPGSGEWKAMPAMGGGRRQQSDQRSEPQNGHQPQQGGVDKAIRPDPEMALLTHPGRIKAGALYESSV